MRLFVLLLTVCLNGCVGVANTTNQSLDRHRAPTPEAERPLILVSIDGFHPDYLDRGLTPTLQRLADEGVRARWMVPSFPSKTFPNHYTIVTGLTPDHHGIVENTMVDPVLGRFELKNRQAVQDARWWEGEPIWVTAQRQGLRSATLFWPGSEAAIDGMRPDDWLPFDAAMSDEARVDQVLEWLARDRRQRPDFITLYFNRVDKIGHAYGPDSDELNTALAAVDSALTRLIRGLETQGLADRANLVIVSDHGMAELLPDRILVLEDMIDPAWVKIVALAEIASFEPRPGFEARAEAALLRSRDGIDCYRKSDMPARWRYGRHPRVPAIVCQLHEGWQITRRESFNPWRSTGTAGRGSHGFDPEAPSMRALFVAHGPAFKDGLLVEPFWNVHVYPLLARLLAIEPAANDGDPAVTAPMLRTTPSSSADQKSEQP